MLPMFTCAGLVVDGARISAARTSVSGAGDLAMNAALSEYDQVLYDVYGLFAISQNMDELESNVSRYFSNSINNSGLLDDSDSYTREFVNSIFSMFSGDELEFSNIVDLDTTNDFSLIGVKDSSIANPTVLERQIVDYMKYRAPINLTKGLLTKLGCIGETSKQTKAVEAKVDYDKKLDTVQDACEKAYEAINTYNKKISDSNFSHTNYTSEINQSIINAQGDYNKMTQYIIALNASSLKVTAVSKDSSLEKEINKAYDKSSSENKVLDTLNTIKDKLKPYIELIEKSGKYEYVATDFMRSINALESVSGDNSFEGQIKYILQYNKLDGLKTVYTLLNLYKTYYNKLSDTDKTTYKNEYNEYEEAKTEINAASSLAQTKSNDWKSKANGYGKDAGIQLYQTWYSSISGITEALDDTNKALDAVVKKVKELDSARTTWGNKVSNLSDGDIKTSMKGDYENSAKDINEDAINKLKSILTNNKKHFEAIKERLDGITFYEKKVCCNDYDSADFVGRFSSSIGSLNVNSISDVTSNANNIMNSKYSNKDANNLSPATFAKITATGDGMQFYKYLEKVCASADAADNSGAKTEATNNKKALIDKGNSSSNTTATGLSGSVPASISDAIPEDVQKALNALYSSSGKNETFLPNSVDKDGSNSKVADQNKSNLTKISTLLEDLLNVAKTTGETARDRLYVEEYMTEMFSCYTDTVSKDGKISAMSLNNKDMSSNKFFGSEVEYILWGNNNVQTNLNYSKALIFGIRFALNSIYAFTSTDTRTPALTAATAIAGWTGFGVPIVQTVILLAWSMAESYVDVDNLCNGEAVVIYKSKDTWVLGIGGVKNVAKEIASKSVDDIFDKIQDFTTDKIDELTTGISNYVTKTTDGVKDSVIGAITAPLEQLTLQIVGSSESLTKEKIQEKYEYCLNSLLNSDNSNSASSKAKKAAIDVLNSSAKNQIVDKLYEIYQNSATQSIAVLNEKVTNMINDISDRIDSTIKNTISSYGDELQSKVSETISNGGSKVKENVTSLIENYTSDLCGSTESSTGITASSGLTLNYKEYLKAFILINMLSKDKENSMLKRTAELIQSNVSTYPDEGSFNVASAYTMVQLSATITVRTTFFNIPIESGLSDDGKTMYSLDYSNIGTGKQKIKYKSVLGY